VVGASEIVTRRRWDDVTLDRARRVGDEPADAVMREIVGEGRDALASATAYLRSLVDSGRPPAGSADPRLERFLEDSWALPEWADPDLIARGQACFRDWGPQIVLSLFCASLPSAYAARRGVQVLALTARLDTDTKRRIMETGQFLVDVLRPGGLDDDGVGRRSIQRVRLMHATVRALVALRAEGDPSVWDAEWGTPINQEDLAGTLQSFAYVVGEPLPKLGVEVGADEAAAYLHLWNVIGTQLGLSTDLQPATLEEAGVLVARIRERQQAPSEQGREMGEALVEFLCDQVPGRFADGYVATLIRYLVGSEVGDMVGVPAGHRVPGLIARLLALVTGRRTELPGGTPWLQHLSEPVAREIVSAAFAVERVGGREPFALPDELVGHWRLPR
jgi:hypothetical protein